MKLDLWGLDVLRGLLAGYVIAGHARWLLWCGHQEFMSGAHPLWAKALAASTASLRFGHEAVMVFFVLSGFFIHLRSAGNLQADARRKFDVRAYGVRRARRIWPPFIIALGITVALDFAGRQIFSGLYDGRTGDVVLDQSFARGGYSLASVLPGLFVLPSSWGRDFGSNGPLWSLAYEVIYYALYPLWLLLRRRSAGLAYGLPVLIAAILSFLPVDAFALTVLRHYPIWLAGAMLAEFTAVKSISRSLWTCSFGAVVLGAVLTFLPMGRAVYLIGAILLGVGVVTVFGCLPATFMNHLPFRCLHALGVRSYTTYICHFPILAILCALSFRLYGGRPAHGWFAVLAVAIALGLTWLLFGLGEKRFLNSPERLRSTPAR